MNIQEYPAGKPARFIAGSLASLYCALWISACGGGGGGSTSPTTSSGATTTTGTTTTTTTTGTTSATGSGSTTGTGEVATVVDTSSTLVTALSTPTYAAGSPGAAVFTMLNQARLNCGMGALAQSVKIDIAAQAHQDWMITNRIASHFETAGTPGFYDISPGYRIVKAGYAASDANEIFAASSQAGAAGATRALRQLLGAPYHLIGAMSGYRHMGVGHSDDTTFYNLVVDFGTPAGETSQLLGGGDIATYPCQGSENLRVHLYGESPNPVPDRDFATNPGGQPVVLMARVGNTLRLVSATLAVAATAAPVTPLLLSDSSTDTVLGSHTAFVLPLVPLAANTQYRAQIAGTNNGVAFSRDFTFTTGGASDEL